LTIEETKINFFDPKDYEDRDHLEYSMEKREEEEIIQGHIDPEEWKKEVEKVGIDLDNIEKDVLLIKSRGGGDFYDDVGECRRHIELIIELCKDIKDTCHQDVRKVFAKSAEALD